MNTTSLIRNNQWTNIYHISHIEFLRVWSHRLTPAIIALLGVFASLYGLASMKSGGGDTAGLYYSFGGYFMYSAIFYSIVSSFIGVTAISEERRNHRINLLISKPLYRRHLILGKMIGLNVYMLCLITMAMTLTATLLIIFYAMPTDLGDFVFRIFLYIFILFIYTSLNIAIAMIIGIVFKDMLVSVSLVTAFIFFDWYYNVFSIIPGLINFDPQAALCHLYINDLASLQSTSSTIPQWIDANAVNLFFFIAAIVILLLISMITYVKEDV